MSLLPALALLATAQGLVPATFYNRPGATPAMLATELRRCRTITTSAHSAAGEERALTPPIGAPGVAPIAAPDRVPPRSPTIENCMVMRGWRLYAIEKADRAALEALDADARSRALARLAGAPWPRGTLLRDHPGTRLHRR